MFGNVSVDTTAPADGYIGAFAAAFACHALGANPRSHAEFCHIHAAPPCSHSHPYGPFVKIAVGRACGTLPTHSWHLIFTGVRQHPEGTNGKGLMDALDAPRVRRFFSAAIGNPPEERPAAIVVTHLLQDRPFFLEAVDIVAEIRSVLPKPKTVNYEVAGWLQHRFPIDTLSRGLFSNSETALEFIDSRVKGQPFVLLDIGGYFSSSLHAIARKFGRHLIGVVEDTENGIQRYEELPDLPCRVYHVARSPLKTPEDFLVGQSIVFSVEALLREQGDILHGRTACVIGYGKLGRSIANLLHNRHVRVVIHDKSRITSVEALSHGFPVAPTLKQALRGAGLVFCATGQISLTAEDFTLVDGGAYIATVTSSDDELQLQGLKASYEMQQVSEYASRYRNKDHVFYILNRGQAVNFIHGAAVGPFIYLVQAEILACIQKLARGATTPGLCEACVATRDRIAGVWYEHFGSSSTRQI